MHATCGPKRGVSAWQPKSEPGSAERSGVPPPGVQQQSGARSVRRPSAPEPNARRPSGRRRNAAHRSAKRRSGSARNGLPRSGRRRSADRPGGRRQRRADGAAAHGSSSRARSPWACLETRCHPVTTECSGIEAAFGRLGSGLQSLWISASGFSDWADKKRLTRAELARVRRCRPRSYYSALLISSP
jgi:hypothetical protein